MEASAMNKSTAARHSKAEHSLQPSQGLLQRKCACGQHTPGGGACAACRDKENLNLPLQAKLQIGAANDRYEQEADRVADHVMRMPAPANNEKDGYLRAKPLVQRRTVDTQSTTAETPPIVQEVLRSPGRPLDQTTRDYMEPRFGYDFSEIKIHNDSKAEESANTVSAKAYTVGQNIVFGVDQYTPATSAGNHLLAHELAHVVQQNGRPSAFAIQRACSDPDFCKPYASAADEASTEWWIRNTYLRAEGVATFGTEVRGLYERYLSRRPGDSLAPVIFDSDSSYLVSSFKNSGDTTDDMDNAIDLVGNRLNRAPGPPLRDGSPTTMSLSNFLSTSEMENRPINYSNPFSVAGHIAGGIGSSDAGSDYRKITYANVTLEKTELLFGSAYIKVELIPHYEVFDAIDFCPGDCGSPAEQIITIPMSRLEAGGAAYDVPFKVIFTPEPRSKRFWL
jgi:hypothetical protein